MLLQRLILNKGKEKNFTKKNILKPKITKFFILFDVNSEKNVWKSSFRNFFSIEYNWSKLIKIRTNVGNSSRKKTWEKKGNFKVS